MLFSHFAFDATPARMTAATLLTRRDLTSMLLLLGAATGLFGHEIGRALKRATRQTTTATPAR